MVLLLSPSVGVALSQSPGPQVVLLQLPLAEINVLGRWTHGKASLLQTEADLR